MGWATARCATYSIREASLVFPAYQMDMVRLGIGLYGIDPSGIIQKKTANGEHPQSSHFTNKKKLKKGRPSGMAGQGWQRKICALPRSISAMPTGY